MDTILIVEDEADIADLVKYHLEKEGLSARTVADGKQALDLIVRDHPSLIILDLMLPDKDGYRVLRELRESGDATPVLILTALGEEADKVRGFRFGADDYVTKPFGLMELLARVGALLRRASRDPVTANGRAPLIAFADVRIDPATRTVVRGGVPVSLRPKEFDLLIALASRQGRVATRTELLRDVWGYDDSVMSRTVDTHIAELRRKLEADASDPRHILTVLKTGYRLRVDSS